MWLRPRPSLTLERPEFTPRPAVARAGFTLEVDGALADQLRQVAHAQDQPPETLAASLLEQGIEQALLRRRAETALAGLTPREREVAQLVAHGRTNQEIAAVLVVSTETVKTHVRHVLEKLGVHSKAELRLRLIEMGVRDWPEPASLPIPRRVPPFQRLERLDLDLPLA